MLRCDRAAIRGTAFNSCRTRSISPPALEPRVHMIFMDVLDLMNRTEPSAERGVGAAGMETAQVIHAGCVEIAAPRLHVAVVIRRVRGQ